MPQIPTEGDWYIVVPLPAVEPDELSGAANVWIVQTTDSDLAAEVAFSMGFPKCAVLLAEYHEGPQPKEEPIDGEPIPE